jgi:hypothetical protein
MHESLRNMSYFLEQFPDRQTLTGTFPSGGPVAPMKVNNHIHTPYSFSAFEGISDAVRRASEEEVRVLGINDFYVTDGYGEFISLCLGHSIFPLLNIELIGISEAERKAGLRVNDPNNPGRTYISGKGLAYPSVLPAAQKSRLDSVVRESNRQVAEMVRLLNHWLEQQGTGIVLSVEEIRGELAVNLLRERHVAKMLRLKVEEQTGDDRAYLELMTRICGGRAPVRERKDRAGTEDELRALLLKAGAPAFVAEDEKAFMPLEDIMGIITDAGGIPTYPMLLDGAGGRFTEYEAGKEQLLERLAEKGFRSVEMIPLRNRIAILRDYAEYFYDHGFMVSFGTEHNTSAMGPLTVSCTEGAPLDSDLMEISLNGAACQAAHQYLLAREGAGYEHLPRSEMEELGKLVFRYYFDTFIPKTREHGS